MNDQNFAVLFSLCVRIILEDLNYVHNKYISAKAVNILFLYNLYVYGIVQQLPCIRILDDLVSAVENNEEMAIDYNDEIQAVPENEVEVETENQANDNQGTTDIG